MAVAERTLREAREHKRLSQVHRRLAQKRMEELRAFCARAGIAIENVKDGGRTGHGQEDTERQ